MPVVACGVPLGHERNVSYVATDDRDGARQIVAYLRSRGRRRIATIAGPMQLPGGVQRLAGYQDAIGGDVDPAWSLTGTTLTPAEQRPPRGSCARLPILTPSSSLPT
jgi:DNA-binding LacI/PurR family transcriptional regulator